MTQEKIKQAILTKCSSMSPENMDMMIEIMEQMVAQQDQQLEGIKQAVIHASFGDVDRGAMVIDKTRICGQAVYDKYRGNQFIIAGLAFAAGIAEGKQRERERRRFARMKAEIRATKAAAKAE